MTDVVRQVSTVSSQVLQLKSPQSSRVASIIGAHVLPAFRMFIFIIICVCPLTNTHGPKLRSFLTRFFNNTCFTYRFCSFFIAQKKNVDGICSSPLCSSDLSNYRIQVEKIQTNEALLTLKLSNIKIFLNCMVTSDSVGRPKKNHFAKT